MRFFLIYHHSVLICPLTDIQLPMKISCDLCFFSHVTLLRRKRKSPMGEHMFSFIFIKIQILEFMWVSCLFLCCLCMWRRSGISQACIIDTHMNHSLATKNQIVLTSWKPANSTRLYTKITYNEYRHVYQVCFVGGFRPPESPHMIQCCRSSFVVVRLYVNNFPFLTS